MLKQTTSNKVVRYKSNKAKDDFAKELRQRVVAYFEKKNLSPYATKGVIVKGIFGFLCWFTVYGLIISDTLSQNLWLLVFGFLMLGFINIFLAFNVMHDACHGAYSKNKTINYILGYTMNFIGGNSYLFTKMHNAHHAFVNIAGIDVTLETHGMFRFTPHETWKPIHKWQHIYTPILYSFAMIHWVFVKDFKWMFGELNIGNKKNIQHDKKEYFILIISKAFYFFSTLVLPLILLSAPWPWILFGWINIHIIPSLCFALLFQVTHIYQGTHYPLPDKDGNIENNYFIHVLETTTDFSRENKLTAWLTGGINIHIVHHLFPKINHAHYIPLTTIIKKTAEDFGIQYHEEKNFWNSLKLHMQMLEKLSKKDAVVDQYSQYSSMA